MKNSAKFTLLAAAALFVALPGRAQQWSQGNPTNDEQNVMEYINRMRANLVGEFTRILGTYKTDPSIAVLLHTWQTYQNGVLETPDQTAASAIANITSGFQTGSHGFGYTTAPLVFYPLMQQRAAYQREAYCTYLITPIPPSSAFTTAAALFDPTATQEITAQHGGLGPPNYIYAPPMYGGSGIEDMPNSSWSGPNASGGTVTYGPSTDNSATLMWSNPSVEGGLTLPQWAAYAIQSIWYQGFLASGAYGPGSGVFGQLPPIVPMRLAGIDFSAKTTNPGIGANIITVEIGSPQFFTSGDDLPFGPTNTAFITGVAYRDANSNGIYDSGEGIGSVTITTNNGTWYAVTSSSGGYAIPVPANSGTYTVTAVSTSAGNTFSRTATVTVAGDNVKLDFALAAPIAPGSGHTRLINISSRAFIGTGASAEIAGFVISGSGATPAEQVLVRAAGPALIPFGVTGTIAQPVLTLYDAKSQIIAVNTGWGNPPVLGPSTVTTTVQAATAATFSRVGAFSWSPGSADSAMLVTLPPGAYTAVASGVNNGTGNAIVEVYEVTSNGARPVNISTRAFIGTDSSILIAGFVISGSGTEQVLIRGIGPALASFGVPGTLQQLVLQVFDSTSTVIASNTGWSTDPHSDQIAATAASVGAFALPTGSADCSVLLDLAPGPYTVEVSGAKDSSGNPTTGNGMVEVYEVPTPGS